MYLFLLFINRRGILFLPFQWYSGGITAKPKNSPTLYLSHVEFELKVAVLEFWNRFAVHSILKWNRHYEIFF